MLTNHILSNQIQSILSRYVPRKGIYQITKTKGIVRGGSFSSSFQTKLNSLNNEVVFPNAMLNLPSFALQHLCILLYHWQRFSFLIPSIHHLFSLSWSQETTLAHRSVSKAIYKIHLPIYSTWYTTSRNTKFSCCYHKTFLPCLFIQRKTLFDILNDWYKTSFGYKNKPKRLNKGPISLNSLSLARHRPTTLTWHD